MYIVTGCVGTTENNLCSARVLKEGALLQGRVSYFLNGY